MTKKKILTILTLLIGLTGINIASASTISNTKLKDRGTHEIGEINSKRGKNYNSSSSENVNSNTDSENNIESINYVIDMLDNTIQNSSFSYFKNEISLTTFKKNLNKNLQKRRKIHKNLVSEFNYDLQSENYLTLLETSSFKINNLNKLKDLVLNQV